MALTRLPQEILILIIDSLDHIDHKSVRSLACVNRDFLSICRPLLYVRALKFIECNDDGEQLAYDILHYSELLQRLSGFWAVRRLIIFAIDNKDPEKLRRHRERRSQQPWCLPMISPGVYGGCEDDYLKFAATKPGDMKYKDTVHQKNDIWKPLAEFILQLPNLECIYYNSYYQLPPCLLDSIHRSQCRLYITGFALWSLGPQGPTDPYELTLMRSPSLHGIGMAGEGVYGNRMVESTTSWEHVSLTEALRYVVSGVPQLKIMIVNHLRGYRRTPTRYFSPPPWPGFTLQRGGLLEHLEIRETDYRKLRQNTKEDIEKWNQDTDFSVLKTFKLAASSALDALEYMATHCQFRSLTELSIRFKPDWSRWHPSDYYSAASSFLLNLPPLSNLELHRWHPKMDTESILKHHGPRLQRLWLLPCRGETVPLETLHHLSENCPVLEELSTRIRRSRGDFQEVSKYKAIGSLPRLKRLFLKLDASDLFLLDGYDYRDLVEGRELPVTRDDASFNSFDQQYSECKFFHDYLHPRNGHIRDAFINAALDENLARSIFRTIQSGNNTDGKDSCPLEVLELRVRGAGQLSWDPCNEDELGFHDVLRKMSRAHRLTRKENGDVEIVLTDIHEAMMPLSATGTFDLNTNRKVILPSVLQIYQRLWPPKNEHWWDDWHSFPLAFSAEDCVPKIHDDACFR